MRQARAGRSGRGGVRARAAATIVAVAAAAGFLASCSGSPTPVLTSGKEYFSAAKYGPASPRITASVAVPKGGGHYMIGDPYRVAGKTYIPADNPRYAAVGLASWYGDAFHGRLTANGEVYDVNGLTAAHPTLPLPSYVRVTNLDNGRSMTVRVNDRGPFAHDRILDVSERVADMLGFRQQGTARVKVQYIGPAQLDGLDTKKLMASYHAPAFGSPVIQVAAAGQPAAPTYMAAAAPTPRVMPRRLPDDAFAPPPAAVADPLVLTPAFAPLPTMAPSDPLAPLIMRAGLSYAETEPLSAAHQAAADLARSDLATALQKAAAEKATEIGGPPAIVQVGSFADRTNAERVATLLGRFGSPEVATRDSGGRTINVVRVSVHGTTPDAVIAAAADMGLSGAFVVSQ